MRRKPARSPRRLDPAAIAWLRPLAADAWPDPRGARHLGRGSARARRQSARTITAMCCSAGSSRRSGFQETLTRMAPLLLHRGQPDRRLSRRHLESRRRRAVPARRRHRRRRRAGARCRDAGLAGARPVPSRWRHWSAPLWSLAAGAAARLSGRQRDHHHADDDLPRASRSPTCWSSSPSSTRPRRCRRPARCRSRTACRGSSRRRCRAAS